MVRQMDFHSRTSQYGSITRGIRYLGLDAALKTKMAEILDEIRSGRFAEGVDASSRSRPTRCSRRCGRRARSFRTRSGRTAPARPSGSATRPKKLKRPFDGCASRDSRHGRSARIRAPALPARLVLYDGVCGFCDGTVALAARTRPRRQALLRAAAGRDDGWLRRLHPEHPDRPRDASCWSNRPTVVARLPALGRRVARVRGARRTLAVARMAALAAAAPQRLRLRALRAPALPLVRPARRLSSCPRCAREASRPSWVFALANRSRSSSGPTQLRLAARRPTSSASLH